MYALNVFTTTVQGLTKQAPIVYFRLTKEIGLEVGTGRARKIRIPRTSFLSALQHSVYTAGAFVLSTPLSLLLHSTSLPTVTTSQKSPTFGDTEITPKRVGRGS